MLNIFLNLLDQKYKINMFLSLCEILCQNKYEMIAIKDH